MIDACFREIILAITRTQGGKIDNLYQPGENGIFGEFRKTVLFLVVCDSHKNSAR